jgi:hypothetical protein
VPAKQLPVTTLTAPPAVVVRKASFINCSSSEDGGAGIYVQHSRVLLDGCQFEGNTADGGCGAAAFIVQSAVLIRGSRFTANVGNK